MHDFRTGFRSGSPARIALLIFVAAFAVRLGLNFALPDLYPIPPREMERVAASFGATGELANPYMTPTGPTAHLLPLYPILLGALYRVFGTGTEGQIAQHVWGCLLSALRCGLIFPLALYLKADRTTAMIAALLSVVYIAAFGTEVRGNWESPLAALFLMAIVYTAVRVSRRGTLRFGDALAAGILAGLSAALNAALIPVMVGFLAWGAWRFRDQLARFAGWAAVVALVSVLILTPWAVRNARRLGAPVWLRSNFGLELWIAYHDPNFVGALDPGFARWHPATNAQRSEEVRALGELEFNRKLRGEAVAWIEAHPRQAARLTWLHFVSFWFPPGQNVVMRMARALFTLLALAGWILLIRARSLLALVVGIVWLTFPAIYYILYWSSRYRYPMEWTMVLCVAAAVAAAMAYPSRRSRSQVA